MARFKFIKPSAVRSARQRRNTHSPHEASQPPSALNHRYHRNILPPILQQPNAYSCPYCHEFIGKPELCGGYYGINKGRRFLVCKNNKCSFKEESTEHMSYFIWMTETPKRNAFYGFGYLRI